MTRETTTGPTPGPFLVFTYERTGDSVEIINVRLVDTEDDARAVADDIDIRTDGTFDARVVPVAAAFAAPDLLAALNHAVEILRCGAFVRLEDPRVAEAVSSALWTARSALARAEGRTA